MPQRTNGASLAKPFAREGLDDEAGDSGIQAARDRFPARIARQHDHGSRRMRRAGFQPLGQGDSVHSRQIDVHEDGRGLEGAQPGKDAWCIRRDCDIETLLLERLDDQLRREGIVLDDEHDRPLRLQLVSRRAPERRRREERLRRGSPAPRPTSESGMVARRRQGRLGAVVRARRPRSRPTSASDRCAASTCRIPSSMRRSTTAPSSRALSAWAAISQVSNRGSSEPPARRQAFHTDIARRRPSCACGQYRT